MFQFIRYTQPAWQFNLTPTVNTPFAACNVAEEEIPDGFIDVQFETKAAQLADAGYRLITGGAFCTSTNATIQKLQQLPAVSLKDEYRFLQKYWGNAWAVFALLVRLATGKNPLKEWPAFWQSRSTKRFNPYAQPMLQEAYASFQSSLIASQPLVAVIIPTLNRYSYLKDVLDDLMLQDYPHFEVLVFDQSEPFDAHFYTPYATRVKAIYQKERLLWTARNNAIKATKASYLLFFDDDSRVEPNWISEHLKCIDFFNADISAGVSLARIGQKIPQSYSYFRWADQFDFGNALVKRAVFQQIGLFDEQYNGQRMGDGEFGYRAYINGFHSISNPMAARVHLKVSSGGLREMGSWDGFRPKKWFAPKPIPSVLYLYRKYLPKAFARNASLIGIMLSNISYRHKGSNKMLLLSILLTIVKSPILLIQYYRASRLANALLHSGKKPEMLSE